MQVTKSATDGLLKAIGFFHPEYAGLIGFLTQHEDQLVAAGPLIQAAAKEGLGAFAAAQKAAPNLAKAIKDFVAAAPKEAAPSAIAASRQSVHVENVTRMIVGAPKMTPAQEVDYIERATSLGANSASGSG